MRKTRWNDLARKEVPSGKRILSSHKKCTRALQIFWELKWILVYINSLENFLADALTVDMKLQLKLVKGSAASLNYVAAADDYQSYSKWFQPTSWKNCLSQVINPVQLNERQSHAWLKQIRSLLLTKTPDLSLLKKIIIIKHIVEYEGARYMQRLS